MIRDLPIPSLRLERLFLLVGLCSGLSAGAHEIEPASGQVFTPILGAGVRYLNSDQAWPVARLPGVLESGNQPAWRQGLAEDYVDLGLQADWRQWRALVKGSGHGPDGAHAFTMEQAWLHGHFELGGETDLTVRAGRTQVPFGLLNREHTHNHDFGINPLIYRASVGEGWRDDGLDMQLSWETGWFAAAGLYAGDSYPGSATSGLGARLLQGGWGHEKNRLVLSIAQLDADGRPTKSTILIGHSHGQSVCHTPVANEVCFEGKSRLASFAGAWTSQQWSVSLDGEAWMKRETGDLFSPSGNADYRGTIEGGWLTAHWAFHPRWQVMLRGEGMTASHSLNGPGAALIANEAGLRDADHTLTRIGLGLNWRPDPIQRLSLEVHQEDTGGTQTNLVVLTRYQVDLGRWLNTLR